MLKYPCLVLDHDDTVVQSEQTINFPCFQSALKSFRPGTEISLKEYKDGCFDPGFVEMCRQRYHFTDAELAEEYEIWRAYVRSHVPAPCPGIGNVIRRQKELGGLICVVSQSCEENILRDYRVHFGIAPDAVYGWDLPEELRKPAVYSLTDIMKRFRLSPQQLLVVDDLKPGRDMAFKAGAACAFAAWTHAGEDAVCARMEALCDYSFGTPQELEEFLFGP